MTNLFNRKKKEKKKTYFTVFVSHRGAASVQNGGKDAIPSFFVIWTTREEGNIRVYSKWK